MARALVLAAVIFAAGAAPAWAVCRDDHGHFAKCGSGGVTPVTRGLAKAEREHGSHAPRMRKPRAPRAPKLFGTRRRRL
jgi:hypothetical protein